MAWRGRRGAPWAWTLLFSWRLRGEGRAELGAASDVELAVRARQVHLDRLDREEQLLGDLGIREARCGHVGDPALARRERIGAAGLLAAQSDAARAQLGSGRLAEPFGAALLRELVALA